MSKNGVYKTQSEFIHVSLGKENALAHANWPNRPYGWLFRNESIRIANRTSLVAEEARQTATWASVESRWVVVAVSFIKHKACRQPKTTPDDKNLRWPRRRHVIPRKIIPTATFYWHLPNPGRPYRLAPHPWPPLLPNSSVDDEVPAGRGEYLQRATLARRRDSKTRMCENFRNYRDAASGRHPQRMNLNQSSTDDVQCCGDWQRRYRRELERSRERERENLFAKSNNVTVALFCFGLGQSSTGT